MKKDSVRGFLIAGMAFASLFAVLLALLLTVDVRKVETWDMPVGLATLNESYRNLIGRTDTLEFLSEVTGALLLMIPVAFLMLGLYQWWKRKSLFAVDPDLFCLAVLYLLTVVFYLIFEIFVVNHRPMFSAAAEIEAAFPSSHVLLALSIGLSAKTQISRRFQHKPEWKAVLFASVTALVAFTVIGRALCGVHWLTDVLGAIFLGLALICFYCAALAAIDRDFSEEKSLLLSESMIQED